MNNIRIFAGATVMAAIVLVWGGSAFAQIDHSIDENESNSGADHDSIDRNFLKSALEGGMVQVQLGQLALQKSSNDQVKKFAQTMVDDHGRLDNDLKPIAQKHGVDVPSEVNKRDQKNIAKISALSGSAFDQAYIKEIVKDHKSLVSEYHDESASFKSATNVDPNLSEAVTSGGHTMEEHLSMAQQLAKSQNVK